MQDNLIVCRNVKVPVCFKPSEYHDALAIEKVKRLYNNKLKSKLGNASFYVYKKSVDARKRDNMLFLYSVAVKPEMPFDEKHISESLTSEFSLVVTDYPDFEKTAVKSKQKPIVVGFGPSGMFCAYALALAGLEPIVVERGSDIDTRTEKVNLYWNKGELDCNTNVQFGEGGAGTFSDGKLLTRISDSLSGYVLKNFVKFGAPEEILYLAKPHVGTDLLKTVVKNIRKEIISLGGKVLFDSKLTGINTDSSGAVVSAEINNGEKIECTALFLCIGHSARDTFSTLIQKNVAVSPKPFSVGVRAEHLQSDIESALYGKYAGCEALEKAQYTLSYKKDNRAVYSFCMCPGGVVVASASDKDEIVTNGMSYYKRDGRNANSAIAVSVDTSDFGNSVIGAIEYQKKIENSAYKLAGADSSAPIQTLGDYMRNEVKHEPSRILPSYTGKTKLCNINKIFPGYINDMLKCGFNSFEKSVRGFISDDVIITAPETRTSSPVRIDRGADLASVSAKNMYPCGEGAGYAGGITSAAVDGLRCAISYLKNISEM